MGLAVGIATLATGGGARSLGPVFEFWGGASRWLLRRAPTGSGGARAMTIGYVVIGQTERDLSAVHWYGVLACYKLGIILEGTHARAAAGKAEVSTGLALHNQTLGLFRRAMRWIG